jgi:hypothetical protein
VRAGKARVLCMQALAGTCLPITWLLLPNISSVWLDPMLSRRCGQLSVSALSKYDVRHSILSPSMSWTRFY